MRALKQNPLLRIVNDFVVDGGQPINISYLWNFGSLLGVCLVLQILTGVFLAMHYTPTVEGAFNSVEHIYFNNNFKYYFIIFISVSNLFNIEFLIIYLFKSMNFSTKTNRLHGVLSDLTIKNCSDKKFYQLFVGFSDGEENFIISLNSNNTILFRFRITLHIDDIEVLKIIHNRLKIGVVRSQWNNCVYVISVTNDILNILILIFNEYPLLTTKWLDYNYFVRAFNIKTNSIKNKISLTLKNFYAI